MGACARLERITSNPPSLTGYACAIGEPCGTPGTASLPDSEDGYSGSGFPFVSGANQMRTMPTK
jgi:hypothetical protein